MYYKLYILNQKLNAIGGNINTVTSFLNKVLALLSAHPCTVGAWKCYVVVIPWA